MSNKTALIVVDVQNDFCPSGALAVNEGDQVIAPINDLINKYDHVILTQDWHPHNHSSFASQHPGQEPFTMTQMPYGEQTLWPDHCIQGQSGAEFHRELNQSKAEIIIRKGYNPTIDSYSAFFENDRKTPTGLGGYLRERGFNHLVMVGLATDFCVAYSAYDAVEQGFQCQVELNACRGIDLNGSLSHALSTMKDVGVVLQS